MIFFNIPWHDLPEGRVPIPDKPPKPKSKWWRRILLGTGISAVIRWALMRPVAAAGFLTGLGPTVSDPTLNFFLRVLYLSISVGLFYYAFELFLVGVALYTYKISSRVWNCFSDAVEKYGTWKGSVVGVWRSIPVLFEPIFWSFVSPKIVQRIVENRPQDPSLRRVGRTRRALKAQTERIQGSSLKRLQLGKNSPSLYHYLRVRGKNMSLPDENNGYGISSGDKYIVDYVLEEHYASKTHWDFRWRHPTWGVVDSVVIPKMRFPNQGERVGVYKVDAGHGHRHLKNLPFKADGYGAGKTVTLQEGKALLWKSGDSNRLHILTDAGDEFAFVKNAKETDGYFLVRVSTSPKDGKPVLHRDRKMSMKDLSRNPEKMSSMVGNGYYAEEKYDGAMFWLVRDKKGDHIHLISRRPAHKDNAPIRLEGGMKGIDRAHWVPDVRDLPENIIPPGTAIQVEVISSTPGEYSSVHSRTAALLNSKPVSSLEAQKTGGPLLVKLLRVDRFNGRDFTAVDPLEERFLRESLEVKSGGVLGAPPAFYTPEEAKAFWEHQIASGNEGVVLKSMTGESDYKVKVKETYDFPIVGIGPIIQKRTSNVRSSKEANRVSRGGSKWFSEGTVLGAGYLEYSTGDKSPGRAGSGLTDNLRKDMWENPEKYLGSNNVTLVDGTYRAIDPSKVNAHVELSGLSLNEKTGLVRAPAIEHIRFDKTPKTL